MKLAAFYKINDASLWKGYDQGWNLVKFNLLNFDVFEVLDDILSEVLSILSMNTPKSHKIQQPVYTTNNEDNIYGYITVYNAFLKFESLENNNAHIQHMKLLYILRTILN